MSSGDATAIPIKNQAFRATFTIRDADGDLVTGDSANLDAEVSKDGGTFANANDNTPTEIATSSGVYFIDLIQAEMNADTVAVQIKSSTTGAKTAVIVLYPQEAGDINVTVEDFASDSIDDDAINSDTDVYQVCLWMVDDDSGSKDKYGAIFMQNGQSVVSGITSPTLWVYDEDASDLVGTSGSPQALTQVGSTGTYKHEEATNRVTSGDIYISRVQATIGGSTRTWYQPIGRDSTA